MTRALTFLLALLALVLAPSASADWRQYRGDPGKTGYAVWGGRSDPVGEIVWTTQIGPDAMIDASPVVGPDGTIYLGAKRGDRRLFAFDPREGAEKWAVSLRGYDVRATPAVRTDGRLIVVGSRYVPVYEDGEFDRWAGRERVFMLSPFTGSILAQSEREWDVAQLTSPLLDRQDNAYFWWLGGLWRFDRNFDVSPVGNGLTGELTGGGIDWCAIFACFDPSGLPIPDSPPVYAPWPSPAYSATCNDIAAGNTAGSVLKVLRVRPHGRELWEKKIGAVTTAAMGKAGRMYVGAKGKRLEAYEQSGRRLWRVSLGGIPVGPPALGRGVTDSDDAQRFECVREGADGSRVTVRDHGRDADDVYVAADDGLLYAFDYKGRLRWKRRSADRRPSPPVVVQGRSGELILVAGDWGILTAWRPDGRPAWQLRLDSPAYGSPAVIGERIYVATQTTLYAIR